jgi:hypothetical protein
MTRNPDLPDFVLLGQEAWRLYRRYKAAPAEFAALATEVSALHIILKEYGEDAQKQLRGTKLEVIGKGCRGILTELEAQLNSGLKRWPMQPRMRSLTVRFS